MDMDYSRIEHLLDRYWKAETTVDEERELRRFFCEGNVPEHLRRYSSLFAYQNLMTEARLDEDFDQRVLRQVSAGRTVNARRVLPFKRLAPLMKAAAAVAVVLLLGNLAERTIGGAPNDVAAVNLTDTIVQPVAAPSMAKGQPAAIKVELDSLAKAMPIPVERSE